MSRLSRMLEIERLSERDRAARSNRDAQREFWAERGKPEEVQAVVMARNGYGIDDITTTTGVDRNLASLLVLGRSRP